MKKEDYIIEPTYQGGYSSMDPDKNDFFTGYHMPARDIGMSTDARTANILKELSESMSSGEKVVELTQVDAGTFEAIPKQHLKEVNQLSKLTGVEITLHAPVIEPSGVGQQGFGESNRVAAERQMMQAIEKAHELNPDGNIPVTFHSSGGLPGEITEPGKEIEEVMVINPDTGAANKIPLKKRYFPGEDETNVKKELEKINQDQWVENIRNVSHYASFGEDAVAKSKFLNDAAEAEQRDGKEIGRKEKEAMYEFNRGATMLNYSYNQLKDLFDTAYKNTSSPQDKRILDDLKKEIEIKALEIQKDPHSKESVML
ncbi:MAG TPA: hypothetical protein ENH46_03350, partial [Candidatus Pacearchaeota archaeon]|nr:hypothetical protein [Candidatus Pacearchaeota archaeon]